MRSVLATNLSGKPVLGADGETLGRVHNVTMNLHTGELVSIVIDPSNELDGFELNDDGHALVPASSIEGLDDFLVVDQAREPVEGETV